MGVDYSSSLCVGVRMSDVFRVETRSENVTKYNHDTGAPYQAQVRKDHLIFFGNEIEEPEESHPSEWIGEFFDEDDLDAHTTGNYCDVYGKDGIHGYDYSQIVIGKQLTRSPSSRSGSSEHLLEVTQEEIAQAIAEVREALAKHGYKGPVNVFLVNYVSC